MEYSKEARSFVRSFVGLGRKLERENWIKTFFFEEVEEEDKKDYIHRFSVSYEDVISCFRTRLEKHVFLWLDMNQTLMGANMPKWNWQTVQLTIAAVFLLLN
jgi:hypothetical protein